MKIWNRIFGLHETRSLATPQQWLLDMFGATPSNSGVTVNAQAAMRCTASRAAIQAISEPLGQLPLHVYQRDEDGSKKRDTEHPVYGLLHDRANAFTTSSDLREQVTRDALLHGNGYAFISRIDGVPNELIRLTPEQMTINIDAATGEPTYSYANETINQTYSYNDILHIKAPSLDGVSGQSPVQQCREAIGLALVLEQHGASLFKNGAKPGGVVSVPGSMGVDAINKMRAGWKAAQEGSGNAGKTAFIYDGASFNQMALSSVDAQYLELRRFAVEEIGRIFRVPPHMLFELGRATWGNASEMGMTFVRFSLMRWIKQWEGECRLKLFSEDEQATHTAEYLLDDFMRSDLSSRSEAYGKLISSRIMSPNEIRARENMPPYPGGDTFENPNTTPSKEPA